MNKQKEVEYFYKLDCKKSNPVIHVTKRTYALNEERNPIRHVDEESLVPLEEISTDQLFEYRMGKNPCLILKKGDKYFYTLIGKDLKRLRGELLSHKCTYCKNMCHDDNILCAKVADRFIECYDRKSKLNIRLSKRLEKYDFIPYGYEVINKKDGAFVVAKCSHYKRGY